MTDKVQKIRAEIKRRMLEDYNSDNEEQDVIAQGVCAGILYFIDSLQEEPVSDDTWDASKQYALRQVLASTDTEMSEQAYLDLRLFSGLELAIAHKDGAKWQKEQFENNRLKHCDELTEEQAQMESDFVTQHIKENNRTPTFIDAIEYGMRLKEEKMMAEAIDVEVKVDAGGYPYIDRCIELYDYDKDVPLAKAGDKYKVVLIKEG